MTPRKESSSPQGSGGPGALPQALFHHVQDPEKIGADAIQFVDERDFGTL